MSHVCTSLNGIAKSYVDFDPLNPDHLRAFKMLCMGEGPGTPLRQHPTLRFNVDQPFVDVRTMMFYRVCEAHISLHSK
jgi:hypothetical protein